MAARPRQQPRRAGSEPLSRFPYDRRTSVSSDEWYTPPEVFDALGVDFALDPAAPPGGVPWVPARRSYCRADDGLSQPWRGRVWLNPPYGRQTSLWLARLAEHGDGLALVFARTDVAWFQRIAREATALCFVAGRLRFRRPDGTPGALAPDRVRVAVGHRAGGFRTRPDPDRPADGVCPMMPRPDTPGRLTECKFGPSLEVMRSQLHSLRDQQTATALRQWLAGTAPVGLFAADARALLAALPPESVDLICTDPPYRFNRANYFRRWFAADLPDDAWPAIFAELYRVLRPNRHAYVFANTRLTPQFDTAARAAGFTVRIPLVWDKLTPGLGRTWRMQYEFICWYEKGHRVGPDRRLGNVLRAGRVRCRYPAEKPGEILQTVIGQGSRPGEIVCDPFCGSGSAGEAAVALGRRALLGDLTPETAAERLGSPAVVLGGPDGR